MGRADGVVHVRRSRLPDLRAALDKIVATETAMVEGILAGQKPGAMAEISGEADLRYVE